MNCSICGGDLPVPESLLAKNLRVPFFCIQCGAIKFNFTAIRGVVFIFPAELPDKMGSFFIPENFKEAHRGHYGIVLAVGKGYYGKKGKFCPTYLRPGQIVYYDVGVPWKVHTAGNDGKEYEVKIMAEGDVKILVEETPSDFFEHVTN